MARITTIEVSQKPIVKSNVVSALEHDLRSIGIESARAFSTKLFSIAGNLERESIDDVVRMVHHPITDISFVDTPMHSEAEWDFAVRVDFKPGVTDNTARVLKEDMQKAGIDGAEVFTSDVHYVKGSFNESDKVLRDLLERVASNPKIHDITVMPRQQFEQQGGFERKIHPVELEERPNFFWVNLGGMDDEELKMTGDLGTLNTDKNANPSGARGGTLALKPDFMAAFKKYSLSSLNTIVLDGIGRRRQPGFVTDTEVELIAQMWSEHCRHTLYNAEIPESADGIFKHYIKSPTLKVLKKKPYLGVSIFKDNSGVFQFDENWLVLIKNETHNSPSAIDPHGGAITGIVGVNRDPAGTGKGGEVIFNFLFYFLGHPEDRRRYFKTRLIRKIMPDGTIEWVPEQKTAPIEEINGEWKLEDLMLNPSQVFRGVVRGVEEGGNKMGIPINLGMCQHHDRYNGKPIVGVGSIGRLPIKIRGLLAHEKHIDIGDRLYIAGGRAGRDGIHGATFSSEALSQKSPPTAVQIGDPYTQRKMFEALLEARDKGYVKFITDLGAGGVSCASLEMAEETGGLEINLDRLLIKYRGMTATELFLNESQERMAIAVDPKHAKEFEAILRKHEVEFSDIGSFNDSGRAVVYANGEKVVDMDIHFIHNGFPKRKLKPEDYKLSSRQKAKLWEQFNEAQLSRMCDSKNDGKGFVVREFYEMHSRPNLASVAPFMDKMDSTVKGLSVQHCIQGKGRVSTKSSCTLVDMKSPSGLIQSYGHAERQVYIDAEKSGKNAFLRSIGNSIAMGGRLEYMVATDQALWQSADDGRYQNMLIEANRGMAEVIEGCEIPVISGKDSMYNQAVVYDEKGNVVRRGVFPTILMTTLAKIDKVSTMVTADVKKEGHVVYVVGAKTKADMGGSEYMNMYSEETGIEFNIGRVSDECTKDVFDTFKRMNEAKDAGILRSAKYIEAGGIAMAARDCSMAGEIGIEFDIGKLETEGHLSMHERMYSETEGRFLVTVRPEDAEKLEKIFAGKFSRIGAVKGDRYVMTKEGEEVLSEPLAKMLAMYHKTEGMKKAA